MTEVIGIDHIYITVSDLKNSEQFYDILLRDTLGFKKSEFLLSGDSHIQYFNRYFGFVIRPAHSLTTYNSNSPGLHHFCFRVDSIDDVVSVSNQLRSLGVAASEPKSYSEYAPDYWATFFNDPDGIHLEITNYRQERRDRHDNWSSS